MSDRYALPNGQVIINVHKPWQCAGRSCTIHNKSHHHMRDWNLVWRNDIQSFERICEHGIGHPDPDQVSYWLEMGMLYRTAHGCDGCCKKLDYIDGEVVVHEIES